METVIIMLQTLCAAGLVLGTALSMYQLMQRCKVTDRFSYAVANDFETGYRRLARSRR
jgi:pentatricopeptide repeat protein